MLPTFAVILWAYLMYAMLSYLLRRKSSHFRGSSRWRKLTWLTLLGGVSAGVGFILWCWISPGNHDQHLKLTGFLGTVYADGWPDRVDRLEYPPVKTPALGTGDQPAYALLHPGTPEGQVEPEKKLPKPRPGRVAKKGAVAAAQDKAGKTAKLTRVPAAPVKKDKTAAKTRGKKKKANAAAGGQAGAG